MQAHELIRAAAEEDLDAAHVANRRPWAERDRDARDPRERRPWADVMVHLDERRTNRVVLLDGPRGSGKTTAMLSLLRVYREAIDLDASWPSAELEQPRVALFPVEILDLQPFGADASLLWAVVSRLSAVASEVGHDSCAHDDESFAESLERRWHDLAKATIASMGYVKSRRANVDPESLAAELRFESLDPSIAFRRAMDQLVREVSRRLSRGPAAGRERVHFVLPIDDADMNPPRAAELIGLLRSLYHPRLSFLLTGDSDLFRRALRSTVLQRLWYRLSELPDESKQLDVVAPAKYAQTLANEIYDRVVPESHRCTFDDLPSEQRVSFPAVATTEEESKKTVREMLDAFEVRPGTSLGALVAARPEVLPGRMRELTDFHMYLERPETPGGANKTLVDVLHWLWQAAIERSSTLPIEDEDRALEAVSKSHGHNGAQLIVYAEQFSAHATMRIERRLTEGVAYGREHVLGNPARIAVRLRSAAAPRKRSGSSNSEPELSRRAAAVLRLLTDVSAEQAKVPRPAPSLAIVGELGRDQLLPALPYVWTKWMHPDVGSIALEWPSPAWRSYAESERFSQIWARYVALAEAERPIDAMMAYLAATTDTITSSESSDAPRELRNGKEPNWHLIDALADAIRTEERFDLIPWLRRLPVCGAPEYGIDAAARSYDIEFFDQFSARVGHLTHIDASELEAVREAKLRSANAADEPAKLLAKLGANREPPWFRARTASSLASPTELARLRRISVALPPSAFAWKTAEVTLADYFERGERSQELPNLSDDELTSLWSYVDQKPIEPTVLAGALGPKKWSAARKWTLRATARALEGAPVLRLVELAPPAGLLHRVAADLVADARVGGGKDVVLAQWPAIVRAKGRAWPAPAFPAPMDHELLAHGWNSGIESLKSEHRALPVALALYLANLADVCLVRRVSTVTPSPESAEALAVAAIRALASERRGEDAYSRHNSARWNAFLSFRRALGVFAIAETGFAPEVRAEISAIVKQHVRGALSLQQIERVTGSERAR